MSLYDDWSDDTKKERTPMNREDALFHVNRAFIDAWESLRPEVRREATGNGAERFSLTIDNFNRSKLVNRFGMMSGDDLPIPPVVEKVVEPKPEPKPVEPVHIQKVEIVISSNQDPSRIAKAVEARLREVANARRMRIERPYDGEKPRARAVEGPDRQVDKPTDTRKAKFVLADAIREVARDAIMLLARTVGDLAAATAENTAAIERANALNEAQLQANAVLASLMSGPQPASHAPPAGSRIGSGT